MNFFIKNRGSVSIFLIIILVPVIAICTIFIDVSRVKLAQGLAYTSGDLALNTVLTQYDTDLSDYYGLMASCQSIDEFYTVAEGYFMECMLSQGVTPTLAQEFATDIMDIVKGKATINDFILIDTSATSATITPVKDANLANPAMLKAEIVEFMKYRGPIDLLTSSDGNKGIYSKLMDVKKNIEVMPAEMQIQKDKMDYYNEENKLMIKALEIYGLLKLYEGYRPSESQDLDKEYLETVIKTDMGALDSTKGLIADYKEIHRKYVSNWAGNIDRAQFKSVATRVSEAGISASGSNVSAGTLKSSIGKCQSTRVAYESAKNTLRATLNGIGFANADQSKVNPIQYWTQMENRLGTDYETYVTALIQFLKARKQMIHNHENRADGIRYKPVTKTRVKRDPFTGLPVIDSKTGGFVMEEYQTVETEKYDIRTDSYNGTTIGAAYDVEKGAADSVEILYKNEKIYSISETMEDISVEALKASNENNVIKAEAEKEIQAVLDKLEAEYAALVTAQGLLQPIIDELPKMREQVEKYHKAFTTWDTDVTANKDNMAYSTPIEQDYYEIQEIKGTGITPPSGSDVKIDSTVSLVEVDIEPGHVEEFQTRLQNTYDLLQAYRDTIESIKYRGVVIFGKKSHNKAGNTGIYTFEHLDQAGKGTASGKPAIQITEEHVYQDKLDAYVESTWDISEEFASLPSVTDKVSGNNPMLHTDDPLNDNNITALDKWFHTQFPDDAKTLAESIDMLKQLKLMMNQLEACVEGMDNYDNPYLEAVEIKDGEELPSSGTAADAEALFNNEKADASDEDALKKRLDNTAGSADTLFADLDFEKLIEEGRDNLYATQYIMGMFSYETSALEGLYVMQGGGKDENDIYKMSDGNKISPGNADTYYNDLLDNPPSTKEGEWWNMKKTFTDNKTLTNKMLDMEHCISYGNEVEYILYGDTNEKNGLKIDTTMAFTRFALNMAPVLSVYWTDGIVGDIAGAISMATQGIVPAPLVKLIICLGVCAAESAVDMNYLKAGLPVAFVKADAKNQLFIELTIDVGKFEDAVKSGSLDYAKNSMKVGEKSITSSSFPFSYSDYLSMYLYIALCANEDDIYKRTADVIQRNMETNYPGIQSTTVITGADGTETVKTTGFRMSKAQTYFQLHADIKVKPLMMKLPYAQMSGIEVLDTATWNTFEIEPMTRGY